MSRTTLKKSARRFATDDYFNLVRRFPLRPIRSDADDALKYLMEQQSMNTSDLGEQLDSGKGRASMILGSAIKPPHPRSSLGVIEDVPEHIDLVFPLRDRFGMASLCEQPTLFRSQSLLSHTVRRVFLGSTDPVADVVARESGEDVDVFYVDGDDEDFDVVQQQFLSDAVGNEFA